MESRLGVEQMSAMERYIIARWSYAIGEEFMDDFAFNRIDREMKAKYPDDEFVQQSWSLDQCPTELLSKFDLNHLKRELKFSFSSESIPSITTEEEYKSMFAILAEETRVSYKVDGWNTQVDYFNGKQVGAETRGRAGNSMRASTILQVLPSTIPYKGRVKIIGESSIPNTKWADYAAVTGNKSQRASVSTALANPNDYGYLHFAGFMIKADDDATLGDKPTYDILREIGIETPMSYVVSNFASLDKAVNALCRGRRGYRLATDGLVIENTSTQVALRIREYEEKSLHSMIVGYIENPGMYGYAMLVQIEPVTVEGSTYSEVSVTNLGYIVEHELKIGSVIAFNIRSAVNCVFDADETWRLKNKGDL